MCLCILSLSYDDLSFVNSFAHFLILSHQVVETLAKLHIIMEFAGGGELFTKVIRGCILKVDLT